MKFFFCLCVLVATCGLSAGITREYSSQSYSNKVSWKEAQNHCRTSFRDLATVTTAEEFQRLLDVGSTPESSWIGLHRADNNTWIWSDGQPATFLNWATYWPTAGPLNCAVIYNVVWYNDPCDVTHGYFYCYRYLIVVNELKTWAEALQYCTTNHKGLVTLTSSSQRNQAEVELTLAQTGRVWVGLHFIDRRWLWISGDPLVGLNLLPSCPDPRYHCGAINTKTNMWENGNCNEKLNFLCWS